MEINLPEVVAEATAAFQGYEKALNGNDVAMLGELFCTTEGWRIVAAHVLLPGEATMMKQQ